MQLGYNVSLPTTSVFLNPLDVPLYRRVLLYLKFITTVLMESEDPANFAISQFPKMSSLELTLKKIRTNSKHHQSKSEVMAVFYKLLW